MDLNIHTFKINDKYLMFSIDNCYITEISPAAYDVLQLAGGKNDKEIIKELSSIYPIAVIEEVLGEIKIVEKELSLCCQSPIRQLLPSDLKNVYPKQLILAVSQECNLSCKYCIVNQGEYGQKGKMSEETARRAIDYMLEKSQGDKNFIVNFFGGEPLVNFPVVKNTAEYITGICHENNVNISMGITTNGTILNEEILECLKKNNISVIISFDGQKEIQDRWRKFRNGKGTHDVIIKNVKKMMECLPGSLTARVTLTKYSPPYQEIGVYLEELGFKDILFGKVSEFPTCNSGDGLSYEELALTEQMISNASEEYFNSSLTGTSDIGEILKYNFQKSMHQRQIGYIKEGRPRRFNCAAGIKTLGVDINGDLYPCQYFIGMPVFKIGDIWGGFDTDKIADFYNSFESNRQKCKKCWAKTICGKGCFFKAVKDSCEFMEPDDNLCNIVRKHAEKVLYLYSQNKSCLAGIEGAQKC